MRLNGLMSASRYSFPSLTAIVAEAAAWCLPRLSDDLRHCWRSEDLRPKYLEPSRADLVGNVVRRRRSYVQAPLLPVDPPGRLLAYFPDAELSDGAAEFESHGFFDVFNEPPWDCWVGWFEASSARDESYRAFLLAWIPDRLVTMATRAIHVNPEECIQWLDAMAPIYVLAVEEAGRAAV